MTSERPVPISADWTIDALLSARPSAAETLLRHGMACTGCTMARFETLAEAAREYGVDIAQLLREINAAPAPRRTSKARRSPSRKPRARRGGT